MFLERETALGALREYAAEAGQGGGRVVLVVGEAGAGKTALVEHLQSQLPAARWSWGSCDGLSTPRPLGPLRDVAASLGGPLARDWRAGAARDQLFDSLMDAVGGSDSLDVVVIEDLQWADAATLDMLRFLARRLRRAALLVIGTYRDDALPADAPLRATVGELGRISGTRRIGIGPLSPAAVAALAGVDGSAAVDLHRLTGGNPYFVSEVLRAGFVRQQADPGGTAPGIPELARDAVLSRVAVLPQAVRATLECASLLGLRFDPQVVLRLTGGSAADIDAGIDAGLLRADGTLPAFRHELTRLAVAEAIPGHRRRDLHSRLFGALTAARCEDDAQLAFHAEVAGDLAATVEYGRRAAERARDLGSHREAAAQYARALAAAEATSDFPDRDLAELYDGLSRAASTLDRWQVALDSDDAARRRWHDLGEPVREGAALQRSALALHYLCRGEEAREAATAAVGALEPFDDTAEYAEACATRARLVLSNGEEAEAIRLARRARAVAVAVGARSVEVSSLITEAAATTTTWVELLRAALAIAVADGLHTEAGRAYANLSCGLSEKCRFAESEPLYIDAVAYCEEHGLGGLRYFIESQRATALSKTGEWAQARRLSTRLLAEGDTSPLNRICAQFCIAVIAARGGEPHAAELLAEPTDAADETGYPAYVVPVHLVGAEVHWIAGDPDRARAEVERAAQAWTGGGNPAADPWLAGEVAVWSARLGGPPEPSAWMPEPYRRELAGEFRAAADWWLAHGCRYDAALSLLGSDEPGDLKECLALLDGLGAVATARGVRRMLRARGVRSVPAGPRSTTRASPAGLTGREVEVLALLCEQQTNAEIARRLVLSPRTVDHHVTAILTKLGVTTRTAAAAEAVRQGLLADAAEGTEPTSSRRDREPATR